MNNSRTKYYPQNQAELDSIMENFYEMNIEVQTLQKHILKIQTQKEFHEKHFNDQVQKLKLYIDQCENQIKKREQREVNLIERLKQLQEQNQMKSHNNSRDFNEIKNQFQKLIQVRQFEWNQQRANMIKDNEALMKTNISLSQKFNELNSFMKRVLKQKTELQQSLKAQNLLESNQKGLLRNSQKEVELLKSALQKSQQNNEIIEQKLLISNKHIQKIEKAYDRLKIQNGAFHAQINVLKVQNNQLNSQNHELKIQNTELTQYKLQSEKKMNQKLHLRQNILPISSSCSNCLKLNKIHSQQMDQKIDQIENLKKDIMCLMTFFQGNQ